MALVQMFIVTENRIIETKYYVKPTNQILFLHFKSNHPPHVFTSIVYSQALQGIMFNSKEQQNIDYLQGKNLKILDQGYHRRLIMEEIIRALEADRKYLMFSTYKKEEKNSSFPVSDNIYSC